MIIEKHTLFYTDREKAEIDRLSDEVDTLVRRTLQIVDILVPDESGQLREEQINAAAAARKEGGELATQIRALTSRLIEIDEAAVTRYITSFKGNLGAITADIKEVLSAVTKEDYTSWANSRSKLSDENERKQYRAGYKSCYLFMLYVIRVQHRAISEAGFDEETAKDLASSRAQDFYKKPQGRKGKPSKEETEKVLNPAAGKEASLNGFYLLAQSHASNKLTKRITSRLGESTQLDLYGNGNITEKDFKLFIKGYTQLASGVKQSAAMLLDSLMITATKKGLNDTLVILPLKEYMEMRGLTDEKEIRRQVKDDIDALERISFEYKGIGKQKGAWLKVSISGGTVGQVKNGDIIFRFNQDFFNSFKLGQGNHYLYMYFPREALQGSTHKNPWKYWLARKISEHKRMNIGKPNEDTISVQTLIESCPNYPTYEEVMQGDRAITRRIIEPFERDLDALQPSINWEYKDMDESPKNYQEFTNANISIHWTEYPSTTNLEAGKKKRAQKVQAAKKKRTQES